MKTQEKNMLWNELKLKSKTYENSMPETYRQFTGSFYTDLDYAYHVVTTLFNNADESFICNIEKKLFLEPCVGSGNFVFAYLKKISEYNFDKIQIQNIINNIYVSDTNIDALHLYKEQFKKFCVCYFDININEEYFKNRIANGLMFDISKCSLNFITLSDAFPSLNGDLFDIIITNPPYKNLKIEQNKKYINSTPFVSKQYLDEIIKYYRLNFKHSNDGIINSYKIFTEAIISTYSSSTAMIALLIPSTILSDKTSEKLRSHMLLTMGIKHIEILHENNKYLDAKQSLSTIIIDKTKKTHTIKMFPDFYKNPHDTTDIKIENIIDKNTLNAIYPLDSSSYHLLAKLNEHPKIKDLPFIVNMRGELDLTANKQYICDTSTPYHLLRGRNIKPYLTDSNNTEYVDADFISKSAKSIYIAAERISCQQISNINRSSRVFFAYIKPNMVLGNSCNFLSITKTVNNLDIFALLGLMNCKTINWYFKLFSSNNHISNYEIGNFPIPIYSANLKLISHKTKLYLETFNNDILGEIDALCTDAYNGVNSNNVSEAEFTTSLNSTNNTILDSFIDDFKAILPNVNRDDIIDLYNNNLNINALLSSFTFDISSFDIEVIQGICAKYKKLKNNILLNHTTFKLSDLDLEMVKCVPQGGNWKNISPDVVAKSKRLTRITETGGRTTLYGRLDYNKPSYTITTYFNRPGNGTYIHPSHNRVLSVREAARLQSFNDYYYFYGNKTNLLNQVGNAVPPILAYELFKKIKDMTGIKNCLDLFCGAGGMSLGAEMAGVNSLISNDIDKNACITFKINHPHTSVIHADITDATVKQKIVQQSIDNSIDLICGGPPCQGFSHAGKRFIDDPRNQLFKEYIAVVKTVSPKIVVMENVEGLLTFNSGKTYLEIIDTFTSLGYKVEGRKLMANLYGVPQKRKRVIIICTKNNLNINPETLFPEPTTLEPSSQITVKDAIFDLDTIQPDDDALAPTEYHSQYIKRINTIRPPSCYSSAKYDKITIYKQLSFL
ncbi:MAG: Alw26I/Eco31I/Esp3I family type II restriction adenine-specific DNA-methyltransferase [Bacillota bacterium]